MLERVWTRLFGPRVPLTKYVIKLRTTDARPEATMNIMPATPAARMPVRMGTAASTPPTMRFTTASAVPTLCTGDGYPNLSRKNRKMVLHPWHSS